MKMKRPFSLRRVVKEWNRENILRFLGYILAAFVINLALECLSRRSFGDGLHYMVTRPWQFFYDSLIILFTLSLSLLFRKRSFCFLLFAAVWIGLGLANCILLGFRATPLTAPDIWLLSSVRDIIEIYMSQPVLILLMLGIAALIGVIVLLWLRAKKTRPSYYFAAVQVLLCGVILAGFTVAFLRSGTLASHFPNLPDAYDSNGFAYCFSASAVTQGISEPDGYSQEAIDVLLSEQDDLPADRVRTPNFIFVQLESFFDANYLKDLTYGENPVPNFERLKETCSSGLFYVPSIGAGTANTEFEFLTGDTMAFLPFGCSPYQMYVKSAMPSLVGGLEAQNYQTVAMHPYLSTSWNRPQVYSSFGFDEQCYEDSFPADAERVRGRVSDSASYKKIIELYESKPEGQPFFLFDVTMQNHGGYEREGYPAFEEKIHLTGEYEGKYQQVDTYLSLVRCSDDAVQELINYFAKVSDDTAIIFFGDHQPNVPAAFYDDLYGNTDAERSREQEQTKLMTPFFIWANYDIPSQNGVEISANYLSALTLNALGCSTSGFDEMRLATRESVPRINNYGYYLADGSWHDGETLSECGELTDYREAQYAQIFDAKKRKNEWYLP